jgi:hypothetical protein
MWDRKFANLKQVMVSEQNFRIKNLYLIIKKDKDNPLKKQATVGH